MLSDMGSVCAVTLVFPRYDIYIHKCMYIHTNKHICMCANTQRHRFGVMQPLYYSPGEIYIYISIYIYRYIYISMYMYRYICMYIHVFIYVHRTGGIVESLHHATISPVRYTCMYINICTYIQIHLYVYICMHTWLCLYSSWFLLSFFQYVWIGIFTYKYIYTCIFVCIHGSVCTAVDFYFLSFNTSESGFFFDKNCFWKMFPPKGNRHFEWRVAAFELKHSPTACLYFPSNYVCMHVCLYVCIYVDMYVFMHACIHECMYDSILVYIHG